jgi:hypothetical protein
MLVRTTGTEAFISKARSEEVGKESRIYDNTGEDIYHME